MVLQSFVDLAVPQSLLFEKLAERGVDLGRDRVDGELRDPAQRLRRRGRMGRGGVPVESRERSSGPVSETDVDEADDHAPPDHEDRQVALHAVACQSHGLGQVEAHFGGPEDISRGMTRNAPVGRPDANQAFQDRRVGLVDEAEAIVLGPAQERPDRGIADVGSSDRGSLWSENLQIHQVVGLGPLSEGLRRRVVQVERHVGRQIADRLVDQHPGVSGVRVEDLLADRGGGGEVQRRKRDQVDGDEHHQDPVSRPSPEQRPPSRPRDDAGCLQVSHRAILYP